MSQCVSKLGTRGLGPNVMATLRTRWLLSILLVNLPTCSASGPPAALSPPDCNIPYDGKDSCENIHCSWDPWLDPQIPTNYSLHWEPANNGEGHVISGTNLSGIILRQNFSHGDLHVWVQAKNQHGSAKSEKATFNTQDIKKPPAPIVTSSYLESSDIEWTFSCDELPLSFEHCDVRHRAEEDQVWVENKTGLHYTFDSHQPYTVYEFQVRCSCDKSLSSDWSAIHRVRTPEMAPVGELDLWRDCGTSQATSDCFLTWKRLPTSQARGLIRGYEVRLTYNNGTAVLVNMSTAGSEGRLVCDEMQCHFNLSLKDVSSASVSAYNALGATVPSYLTMPISGKEKNKSAIHLKMNEDNLIVSWGLPSQLSDNLKEYVVQYNQAGCPPGQQFDWIKVNKSQTTGIFKGQYKKYTPYQVSLFTVLHSNEVHHLSSVIGYSLEGTPSTGPSFKVSIADTHVTLFWEPVPLCMQNGVILSYEVIVDGRENRQKVYNVSASPQRENMTFKLQDLSPGQQYDVWIRAVTAAGPGANTTVKVKTKHPEDFGPPAALSPPDCNIPYDGKDSCENIHCSWDPWLDPQIPTNYSLHWEPANNGEGHVISGTNLSGIILRENFSHGDLHVWVQAKNQHGSAKSEKAMFNTQDIKKPPAPIVTSSYVESLDIEWTFSCDELPLSFEHCDVRHRAEEDQVWVENKTGLHYTFDSHQPYTVYEFQVRCSCDKSLSSDWTAIHRVRTPEMAPVGELDLWRDCGTSQATSDCFLTWKRLPTSQARGLIRGYEVRLTYNNGTAVLVNMSTAGSEGRLVCDEMQCHFNLSLKDVSSASVSAYNALGATVPSYLTMPISGKEKNKSAIHLKMNEDNLIVSWGLPSQLSDNLKEYVVQYNQAGCPPGQQFDWIKVNKSQTTGIFKGQYKKYTPYQVSLFTVLHGNEVHHLSSVIGYSLEGTPSTGPSFKVSIADTHVTLFWEPVPLCMQNGVILSYEVIVDGGENRQKVYNVSASPQRENMTFKLQDLSPGQQYDVWIRAVTAAGPGANTTMKVKTKHSEDFATLKPLLLGIIFVFVFVCFIVVVLYRAHQGEGPLVPTFLYEKVPDARNSHIFRHMKHQINDPLAWICIPVYEPHPIISVLEVVEIQPRADGLTQPVVGDQCSQTDSQDDQGEEAVMEECHRTDRRYGREEYSRMVDSDEETDRKEEHREDSWSSAEDEQSTSGYEKHFMPTALEVLEV